MTPNAEPSPSTQQIAGTEQHQTRVNISCMHQMNENNNYSFFITKNKTYSSHIFAITPKHYVNWLLTCNLRIFIYDTTIDLHDRTTLKIIVISTIGGVFDRTYTYLMFYLIFQSTDH
jgi:hypothetical protein